MGSVIDNENGDTVHNKHHGRHHKCHTAIDKQVCLRKPVIGLFKTLLLVFLTAEGPDNRNTCQDFPGNQVQLIDQILQFCKLWHSDLKEQPHQNHDRRYCHTEDPGHGCVCLQYL